MGDTICRLLLIAVFNVDSSHDPLNDIVCTDDLLNVLLPASYLIKSRIPLARRVCCADVARASVIFLLPQSPSQVLQIEVKL